jgi:hypothetical protein
LLLSERKEITHLSIESHKMVARRSLAGDPQSGRETIDIWDEICDPEMTLIEGPGFEEVHGLENLKNYARHFHVPAEHELIIEEMIGEGDKVVASSSAPMTAKVSLTLPNGVTLPAGKALTTSSLSILTLRGGKIIEEKVWGLDVTRQLGDMPASG